MKLVDPNDEKIKRLYEESRICAQQAVIKAVQCGALLVKKRQTVERGEWLPYLESLGIPQRTAHRYMVVAEQYSMQDKKLMEGKSLIELYREWELITPAKGGGARNGRPDDDDDKAPQLEFHFEVFFGMLAVVKKKKENPFIGQDKKQLQETIKGAEEVRRLASEALKEGK